MADKKSVVLIGPVFPYKGGIAHYTGLMYKALKEKFNVNMMSYKLQYPKILFRKEQKDFSNETFKVEPTQYNINTVNPFNWVSVAAQIKRLHPDVVVIQWWHPYFAPCYWSICHLLKNIKVIFICHNVFPHERFLFDRFLTKKVLCKAYGYVVQSSQDERDLLELKPEARYRRTVHPTYNAFKIAGLSKQEARRQLGLAEEEKVLLFFGFVREYKGLKYLLEAMPKIIEAIGNVKLLVVGDFDNNKQEYLDIIQQKEIDKNIDIYDGYIQDREVEKFFAATDLVVCPYKSATQSGIVQIAYGFEKPVVATNVGGLPDVIIDGKTGFLAEKESSDDLAEKIIDYFVMDAEAEFVTNIKKEADKYSWERMTDIILELSE